jgi:hypothetical protein
MLYFIMTRLLFIAIGAGLAATIVGIIGLALQSTIENE